MQTITRTAQNKYLYCVKYQSQFTAYIVTIKYIIYIRIMHLENNLRKIEILFCACLCSTNF